MLAVETDDQGLVQSYPTYVIKKIKFYISISNSGVILHNEQTLK